MENYVKIVFIVNKILNNDGQACRLRHRQRDRQTCIQVSCKRKKERNTNTHTHIHLSVNLPLAYNITDNRTNERTDKRKNSII